MSCDCRTGARCLPCIERDGLTRPKTTLHLRVTLPHLPNLLARVASALKRPHREETELARALREEWCNGCHRPRSEWGPVCPGMTVGDFTHYHSPDYWRIRLA